MHGLVECLFIFVAVWQAQAIRSYDTARINSALRSKGALPVFSEVKSSVGKPQLAAHPKHVRMANGPPLVKAWQPYPVFVLRPLEDPATLAKSSWSSASVPGPETLMTSDWQALYDSIDDAGFGAPQLVDRIEIVDIPAGSDLGLPDDLDYVSEVVSLLMDVAEQIPADLRLQLVTAFKEVRHALGTRLEEVTTALGLSSVKELRELAEAVISQVIEGSAMDQTENATKLLQLLDERVPANIRAEVRRRIQGARSPLEMLAVAQDVAAPLGQFFNRWTGAPKNASQADLTILDESGDLAGAERSALREGLADVLDNFVEQLSLQKKLALGLLALKYKVEMTSAMHDAKDLLTEVIHDESSDEEEDDEDFDEEKPPTSSHSVGRILSEDVKISLSNMILQVPKDVRDMLLNKFHSIETPEQLFLMATETVTPMLAGLGSRVDRQDEVAAAVGPVGGDWEEPQADLSEAPIVGHDISDAYLAMMER
mmetsp:Transcript_7897/g.21754  ORF Transcript_7897/g.21754 Transcript_7897/m.21754 type:complete len:484 (-) Transcript_7897:100-1551(-)|eukprot:CAMPEP_0194485024 /NCGR_PEP_ID=MMETSP0253-20130528/6157_1 /TAXON_ID=2966 /ORGANISM="Noctiluca scintillans" /LENGTH=483 /DNA_ID=CAMNT_0039324935 /DNA_START=50 /DNA_END=1501 /DNA_ORIENTATION=-